MTLVVAVDPSSIKCGYALLRSEGPRLTYLAAGVIDAGSKRSLCRRLVEIGAELHDVCDEAIAALMPGEDIIAGIESGYVDSHGPTALVLGAARGVAMYVLGHSLGCEVREYAPSTVKKAATSNGRADKGQVARIVAKRLRMKREPAPDAADALACAIARAQDTRHTTTTREGDTRCPSQ